MNRHKKYFENVEKILKLHNINLSKIKRKILDILLTTKKHLSLSEIFYLLKKNNMSVGQATVFRTLKILNRIGIVDKIETQDKHICYEVHFAKCDHDHMCCLSCGKVIEFSSKIIEKQQRHFANIYNFKPLFHRHVIYGYCAICDKNPKN